MIWSIINETKESFLSERWREMRQHKKVKRRTEPKYGKWGKKFSTKGKQNRLKSKQNIVPRKIHKSAFFAAIRRSHCSFSDIFSNPNSMHLCNINPLYSIVNPSRFIILAVIWATMQKLTRCLYKKNVPIRNDWLPRNLYFKITKRRESYRLSTD